MVAALVALAGVLSISFLGRNASSKFSSIGMAIGDGGGAALSAPSGLTGNQSTRTTFARTPVPAQAGPIQTAPTTAPTTTRSTTESTTESTAAPPTAPDKASPTGQDVTPSLVAGRAFVSNAAMTVRTDDLSAVKASAIAAVESAGGGLFGEESSFDGDAKAVLTFKVPPERFRETLTTLERLGDLQTQAVSTSDVTDQVIDLDARISAATASLDRTRVMLDNASSLAEVTTLDSEVSRRQADLEKLIGQRQTLGDRTELATIVLTVVRPEAPAPTPAPTPKVAAETTPPGFIDGLHTGWAAFVKGGSVVLAGVGLVLPFLLVIIPFLTIAWLVLRLRDRRGRGRTAGWPLLRRPEVQA